MLSRRYQVDNLLDWAYAGVDHQLEGNGGPKCVQFLEPLQRSWETLLMCLIAGAEILWGHRNLSVPDKLPPTERVDRTGKRFLLVLQCMTFGIEVGFKFATKQVIYLLNPCHVCTMIQIYLLAAPPSLTVLKVFRMHMHFLQGATLAIVFPVVNTRLLPFEAETYWIQHIMLLVIPCYLMRLGGPYTVEPLLDMSWLWLTIGLDFMYHCLPLQILGLLTEVNLNNMLCPAISDPFYGRHYRQWAVLHQTSLLLVHGKLYTFLAQLILPYTSTTYLTQLHLPRDFLGLEQPAQKKSAARQNQRQESSPPAAPSSPELIKCLSCGARMVQPDAEETSPVDVPAAEGGGTTNGSATTRILKHDSNGFFNHNYIPQGKGAPHQHLE